MKTKYSHILNQNITISETGIIITEDRQEYSRQEQAILKPASDDTKQKLHTLKNIFKGVIHKPFRDDLRYYGFNGGLS